MEHYWLAIEGPQWFSGGGIFAEQVRSAVGGAVFVELGAWKGRSASFMGVEIANSGKPIAFFSVDHWGGTPGESAHDTDADVQGGTLYEAFMRNTDPVRRYVRPIRSETVAAARQFGDQTVDFLYVDADHTFAGVTRDLDAWWPKLKPGAVMAGDDWCFYEPGTDRLGVREAVMAFAAMRNLEVTVLPGHGNPAWEQWLVRKPVSPRA